MYLAKNFSKYIHSGGLDAEPPVKVAEVVKELLEVLRVVDLAHNLLYHTQNVHPVPATAENASRKSFNSGPPHLTTQGLFRPCECPFTLKGI